MNISLNGKWKVNYVEFNQDITSVLSDTFVPEGWIDADVPEDIHRTLQRAGIIRGFTYNKNENEESWIEQKDWIYYKEFFLSDVVEKENVFLKFQGLDTFCDIFLNGEKIGTHQNMFVPLEIDVKSKVNFNTRNVIVVRIYSPIKFVEAGSDRRASGILATERVFARKAQMSYSWDFCGRCVTIGIWKDVELLFFHDIGIDSYYLYTKSISNNVALLELEVTSDIEFTSGEEEYLLRIELDDGFHNIIGAEETLTNFQRISIEVPNPQLWWPRPYGRQFLYDFTLTLSRKGEVIDVRTQKYGIRTIEVIEEETEHGKSFLFQVNGRRIFVRGANWMPPSMIFTDIKNEDYKNLVDYAIAGNLTMLRIWGGGIYENKTLFELCDQYGILLWCDFMMACGLYPHSDSFMKNMAVEAASVIKDYRNYTCLAIWSGDNENGLYYCQIGRRDDFQKDPISKMLGQVCNKMDGERYYLPTSPGSPDEFYLGGDDPESFEQGDQHCYYMYADPKGGNGAYYYKNITKWKPKFVSECGFISFPEKDTFYKFNFQRESIRYPDELVRFLPVSEHMIKSKEYDRLIYYSQLYQAMGLKYFLEYFRALKGICWGALYWKFNDPLSDSPKGYIFPSHMAVIDMYQQPKMAYYYTRRAFEDLICACVETEDDYEIYVCNEKAKGYLGELSVTHRDFTGVILGQISKKSEVRPDSSSLICSLSKKDLHIQNLYGEYLLIEFIADNVKLQNRFFFNGLHEINRLVIPKAKPDVRCEFISDYIITIDIETDLYLRNIRIHILDYRVDYSDNYFDMDAGTHKQVFLHLHTNVGIENTVIYIEGENIERSVIPVSGIKHENYK